MSGIRQQADDLIKEVKALSHFFMITDEELTNSVKAFEAKWEDSLSTNDDLQAAVDVIEARMEDVCILNRIGQERLEELMERHPSYAKTPI